MGADLGQGQAIPVLEHQGLALGLRQPLQGRRQAQYLLIVRGLLAGGFCG